MPKKLSPVRTAEHSLRESFAARSGRTGKQGPPEERGVLPRSLLGADFLTSRRGGPAALSPAGATTLVLSPATGIRLLRWAPGGLLHPGEQVSVRQVRRAVLGPPHQSSRLACQARAARNQCVGCRAGRGQDQPSCPDTTFPRTFALCGVHNVSESLRHIDQLLREFVGIRHLVTPLVVLGSRTQAFPRTGTTKRCANAALVAQQTTRRARCFSPRRRSSTTHP